jgi:23S rRNA (uracil1939-C5)-methyltransferase
VIKIEKIIPGGQALSTAEDGRKIFFWNALPGEIVLEYRITKQKSHYYEAIATKIDNPSKYRVKPKDDCYLSTSPWQIIDWRYENELKRELVKEIFHEHQINIDAPPVLTDDNSYFYRNKMEYALYWDNQTNQIKLAFHERGSHRKIPITQSSIERPEIFNAATKIIDNLNSRHTEARKYQLLLLRCNQAGEVSGGLYENHQPHPVFSNLTDTILNHKYSYSPNGFFQINLPVYELALKEIKKHVNVDNILDLYAGVGTIGLSVARDKSLTLVEVDKSAFTELEKNCGVGFSEGIRSYDEDERAGPVTTGAGDAPRRKTPLAILAKSEAVLDYIQPNQTVILDPPRAGCDKKLINQLNKIKPTTIIYLSCNPATQARDVKILLENYQIKDIKTFNFFPRTPHIENLIVLEKI